MEISTIRNSNSWSRIPQRYDIESTAIKYCLYEIHHSALTILTQRRVSTMDDSDVTQFT